MGPTPSFLACGCWERWGTREIQRCLAKALRPPGVPRPALPGAHFPRCPRGWGQLGTSTVPTQPEAVPESGRKLGREDRRLPFCQWEDNGRLSKWTFLAPFAKGDTTALHGEHKPSSGPFTSRPARATWPRFHNLAGAWHPQLRAHTGTWPCFRVQRSAPHLPLPAGAPPHRR